MVQMTDNWNIPTDQWGCDTCGRIYWRLEDCPIVKVRKVGLIIGLRKKVYVNKCHNC